MLRRGPPAAAERAHDHRRTDGQGLMQRVVVQPGSVQLEAGFQIERDGIPVPVHPAIRLQLRGDEIEMLLHPQAVLPGPVGAQGRSPVAVVVPVERHPAPGFETQAGHAEQRGIPVREKGRGTVPDEKGRQAESPPHVFEGRADPLPVRLPPVPFPAPVEASQDHLPVGQTHVPPESGQGRPLPPVHVLEARFQPVRDEQELAHGVLRDVVDVHIADIPGEGASVGRQPAEVGPGLVPFLPGG